MARRRAVPAPAPRRVKLNLSLDPQVHARLSAYAAFRREEISAVVTRAVEAEMRAARFVVYLGAEAGSAAPPPAPTAAEGPGVPAERSSSAGPTLRAV
jgi:hypothetical protein